MAKLKGRLISRSEAVADINKYLDIRDRVYDKINDMLNSDPETSGNQPLKQYFQDDENSFFFNIDMLQKLIDKGKASGANCIRVYYGAAAIPTDPESLRLFNELGINEGSSTLVLVPCFAEIDPVTQEVKKIANKITNDGEDGGQWPGGSFIAIGGRVGADGVDETLPTNITLTPISVIM